MVWFRSSPTCLARRVTCGSASFNSGDSLRFPDAVTKGAMTLQWRSQTATTLSPLKCLCPRSSEIIAAFQSRSRRPIAVDNADVKVFFLLLRRHRTREHGIEAPVGFIAPKGSIDPGVVNFRLPLFVLFNGQFFPLTAEVQEFKDIVEYCVLIELRLRTATPHLQVGQDKFLKLF